MTKKVKKYLVIGNIFLVIIFALIIWNIYNPYHSNFNNNNQIEGGKPEDNNLENNDNLPQNEIVTKLVSLAKEDNRIEIILQNYDEYPEALLGMLSRNIDMLDFVLAYPKKKGTVYDGTIGEVKKGVFPLLLQYDERWGYADYGDTSLAIAGCAPTALAIVCAGLTGNNKVTPYTIAKYAEDNGYYLDGIGTTWDLMTTGSKHFGITGKKITLSKESIYNFLEHGHPIICSMRPGDFTTEGHFIVLTGIKDGKIKINDPNSTVRSNKLWDYNTLEHQIKALWSYSETK